MASSFDWRGESPYRGVDHRSSNPVKRAGSAPKQSLKGHEQRDAIEASDRGIRNGRELASRGFMESVREFDAKNPIEGKVLAYGSIVVIAAASGYVADLLIDTLAHLTERKNDQVGKLIGTVIGLLIGIQQAAMLAGFPKKLEMWMRARAFSADSKTPEGQARQLIEERALPLLMAMYRNAKSLNGVQHEQLVLSATDVKDSLDYISANGISKKIWQRYLIELDKKPTQNMPYFRASTSDESVGIQANKYYVSKYTSANHLLQRDWSNSFDYNFDRVKSFLNEAVEAKYVNAEDLEDLRKAVEDNNLDALKKAVGAKGVEAFKIVLNTNQLEALRKAVEPKGLEAFKRLSEFSNDNDFKDNVKAAEAKDLEAFKKLCNANALEGLKKEVEAKGLNALKEKLATRLKSGTEKPDTNKWLDNTSVIEDLQKFIEQHLKGGAGGFTNGVANIDELQLENDGLFVELANAFRNAHGDEEWQNRTYVRVDELTKVSLCLDGMRDASMYNMLRNFNDSLIEGLTGALNPFTQARNGGTSSPMYLPMVSFGSVVTVLGLGISSTPTPPPTTLAENGKNASASTSTAAQASTAPNGTVIGGPLTLGNTTTGESPVLQSRPGDLSQQTQQSMGIGLVPSFYLQAQSLPPAMTALTA